MTAIVALFHCGPPLFHLIGERRQALTQHMKPGDLVRVLTADGARKALLRFEAQVNNIHSGLPSRSPSRSHGKERVSGHG